MKDTVILITGCSSGIGHDLAARLADSGYCVIATARKAESLATLPVALRLSLDVTDQASVDAAVKTALDHFGKIDVLVNNAGYAVRSAVEEIDEDQARKMYDVNVWGLLRMTKAILPYMRARKCGRIIHVGSVVGKFSWPINGAYSSSKHAVEALSDSMRVELKPFGIQVALVEPGTTNTNFMTSSEEKSRAHYADDGSPYRDLYARFRALSQESAHEGAPAERVSRVIQKAIEARKPKARYLAAISPLYRALLHMGDSVRDGALMKIFKIRVPSAR